MIDFASINDIGSLEQLASRCFSEMRFNDTRGYNYDPVNTIDHLSHLIESEEGIVLKHIDGNQINGFIAIVIQDRNPYHKGDKIAVEVAWHSDPLLPLFKRSRIMYKLLDCIQLALKANGIKRIQVGAEFSGSMAIHKLLTRHGFNATCVTYAKEI